MLKSVGQKLMVAVFLPMGLLLCVAAWFVSSNAQVGFEQEARRESVAIASMLAKAFASQTETTATAEKPAHAAVTSLMAEIDNAFHATESIRVVTAKEIVRWSVEPNELGQAEATLPVFANAVSQPLDSVGCEGCHAGTFPLGVVKVAPAGVSGKNGTFQRVFLSIVFALLALGVTLLLALALGLKVFLTRPLNSLSQLMKRAEEGDLVVRARAVGEDEVGRLAASFNRMLARLTALRASEIDHQRSLETARTELELKKELETVNSRLQRRLDELQILFDLSRTLASTLELSFVLDGISTMLSTRLVVPKFSIMLLGQSGKLEIQRITPDNAASVGLTFEIGEGICGLAADSRKATYVPSLAGDTRFRPREGTAHPQDGCLLSVPMVVGQELIGVLNFERERRADFSADEIEFFGAIADQAAVAIQKARLHEQTVTLSITDPLTLIPNRRFLFQQIESEINRANRFGTQLSLLMIDIDHFKKLNDQEGHQAGDDVLRKVAETMKASLRKVDTVGRYGGEEFIVLLPQVTRAEALEVGEKLRRAVQAVEFGFRKKETARQVSISVGVASMPVDASAQTELVDAADAALYIAKREGRNKVVAYGVGMEIHPERRRKLSPAS